MWACPLASSELLANRGLPPLAPPANRGVHGQHRPPVMPPANRRQLWLPSRVAQQPGRPPEVEKMPIIFWGWAPGSEAASQGAVGGGGAGGERAAPLLPATRLDVERLPRGHVYRGDTCSCLGLPIRSPVPPCEASCV